MTNSKLIPLARQPAYVAAIKKVVEISAALTRTTDELERLRGELQRLQVQDLNNPQPNAIERALAIATGTQAGANPTSYPSSLATEIERLADTQKALQVGLREANAAADRVAESLSREVGTQAKARHVEAVQNILQCLEQLCEANKAEEHVRAELEKLGYDRHGLPAQGFQFIGRIDDLHGTPAYYFAKDAGLYIARYQG